MSKEPVKRENEHASARQRAQTLTDEERVELDRRQRSDPEFIEKTKPEDPSPRPGQLTRDNVNPNIPSGPKDRPLLPDGRVDPNAGGIVDPNTLGMDQGIAGEKPPPVTEQREGEQLPEGVVSPRLFSINEPPGSNVYARMPQNEIDNTLPPEGKPPPGTEPPLGGSRAARGPEASDDPDEIEDELDQMKEEGEVETRGKPAPKKK